MPKFNVTLRAYDDVYREIKVEVEAEDEDHAEEIAIDNDLDGIYDVDWEEADYVAYDGNGVEVECVEPVTPRKRAWNLQVVEGGVA